MSSRLDNLRDALDRLKQRLAAGELDEATFDRLRDRIVGDLSPDDRSALGISPAPIPVNPAGFSPRPGTPTPVGPSGGLRGGLRTARASLADLELEAGSVLLGQWRLVRELGRGGFGAVFEAEELSLGERHAVKVLDPAMVAKEELLARFRREVSLMRKLVHPRIVRVYDYREDLGQNLALISMELVAEGSVKHLVAEAKRRGAPIPLDLALDILGQILEALAEAHSQGVIHRDVTPGNVLLAGGTPEQLLANPERDPNVKLVDFGIAGLVERTELSAKSRVLGTAAYVAPEVLDPAVEVTPQADVYGAGAMGYELVTGRLPVGRFDEPIELRPELGRELNRYLLNLLSSRPEARPGAQAAARGLRELREEAVQRQAQEAEAKAREQEEARARQLAEERQRRDAEQRRLDAQRRAEAEAATAAERQRREAALREAQEAERRAIAAERQAAAERQRQAEQIRLAEEARQLREASPAPVRAHPSMAASVRKLAKRGPSPLVWLGIVALVAAVVVGISWGIAQGREAERQRAAASGVSAPRANSAGIEWVRIPGGSFTMGCTSGDAECDNDEKPAHRVTVRGFQMASTETTVYQYQACVGANRCRALSGSQAGGDHPVVSVDWNESKAFCEWAGGRLPSESEWEYAARGGREGWKYPWGNSISHENANYTGTGGRDRWDGTSPVKSFAATGFGLYDMSGNVWEWVEDVWHHNYSGAPSDGSVWTSGGDASRRVLRGGSWNDVPGGLRVSSRGIRSPDLRSDGIGFRCARTEIP